MEENTQTHQGNLPQSLDLMQMSSISTSWNSFKFSGRLHILVP